jgi:hypothetical protein
MLPKNGKCVNSSQQYRHYVLEVMQAAGAPPKCD